eukprot:6198910-Pleurochrysis_carterae.AAC.1
MHAQGVVCMQCVHGGRASGLLRIATRTALACVAGAVSCAGARRRRGQGRAVAKGRAAAAVSQRGDRPAPNRGGGAKRWPLQNRPTSPVFRHGSTLWLTLARRPEFTSAGVSFDGHLLRHLQRAARRARVLAQAARAREYPPSFAHFAIWSQLRVIL